MPVHQGDVLRVAARCKRGDEADVVNVFYLESSQTDPSLANEDVLNAISAWLTNAYNDIESYIPSDQNPIDIRVDKVGLVSGLIKVLENVGTTTWGATFDPSGTGEGLPRGVAALVFLLTSVGKVFGRKYVGTLTEAASAGDSLVTGAITALGSWLTKMLTPVSVGAGNDLFPGILSTRTLGFERFVGGRVRGRVGYQRRRAPGVGS